jgi:excisionase family DNA binding protein
MAKSKEIFTIKEIADYLEVHPMTVYKYVQNGKIPAFKIGTSWRIRKESIEKWINENELKGKEAK